MKLTNTILGVAGAVIGLCALVLITTRVGHTTTGGPVSVTITNPFVKTRDADNPAQQPIVFTLSPSSVTQPNAQDIYTVPAGKRLVIEYYSAQLTQYPSGGYGYMYLDSTTGGNTAYYKVIPPVSTLAPYNQLTRMYADAGTQVVGIVAQSSGASCGGSIIVSGYLVNVP